MIHSAKLQYQGRRSWLHRLHPLAKLAWLVCVGMAAFVYHEPAYVAALLLGILLVAALGRTDLRRSLRGPRLLLLSTLGLLALQALFYQDGRVLVHLWPFGQGRIPITDQGLRRGIAVAGRFLAIVVSSQLFVLITDPSDLAYALMQAGLPYRYGFALVTALRMAPVFEGEATTIYYAQLTRGVRYDAGGLRGAYKLLRQFMLPLLVSALRKADALAVSMEGRHFGRYATRTYLKPLRFGRADWLASLVLLIFVTATIWLRITN